MTRSTLIRAATVLLLAASALAACGKKPGSVDAPPGTDPAAFPRVYPDPRLDGAPVPAATPQSPAPAPADGTPAAPVMPGQVIPGVKFP